MGDRAWGPRRSAGHPAGQGYRSALARLFLPPVVALPRALSREHPPAMTFRLLLGLDSLAALVVAYFFLAGLADGSVSDFNIELWIGIILAVTAVIAGGLLLRRAARPMLANLVLALLAVPTALYGLFLLVVVFSGTTWN